MKKFVMHFAPVLASFALFIGITSVNTPSALIFHQPKTPTILEKYRK